MTTVELHTAIARTHYSLGRVIHDLVLSGRTGDREAASALLGSAKEECRRLAAAGHPGLDQSQLCCYLEAVDWGATASVDRAAVIGLLGRCAYGALYEYLCTRWGRDAGDAMPAQKLRDDFARAVHDLIAAAQGGAPER